jgi:hypothetical protein
MSEIQYIKSTLLFPSASRQLNTRDRIHETVHTFFEARNQTILINIVNSSETLWMQPDARAILTKEPVRRKSGPSTLNLLPTAYGDYCSSRRQKWKIHDLGAYFWTIIAC